MSMSGQGWKAVLELELGWEENKSKLNDDDRVERIIDYLLEKPPSLALMQQKKEQNWKCLSCLDNESLKNYVALWTLGFA
jgi:hypothetical protein